jgi:hypothetical protein
MMAALQDERVSMSANRHTVTVGLLAVLAAAAALVAIVPAFASKPVPKTIVGCVFNATFVSSDGYDIHPRDADGKEVDLRPFEGHTVTISGDLLPGDAFIIKKAPRDSGPCKIMRPAGR